MGIDSPDGLRIWLIVLLSYFIVHAYLL